MPPRKITAKRRLDQLMRHLTAEPAEPSTMFPNPSQVASSDVSPRKSKPSLTSEETSSPTKNVKAALAERKRAQRERLHDDWNYDLDSSTIVEDEDQTSEPETIFASSIAANLNNLNPEAAAPEAAMSAETSAKTQFATFCRSLACMGLVGKDMEDFVTYRVAGLGYLYKPFGIRFEEVNADMIQIQQSTATFPKLHEELHASEASKASPENWCVVSFAHADAEFVALSESGLLPLSQDSIRLLGQTRRAEESNVGMRCGRSTARDANVWFLKNRGVACVGPSLEAAMAYSYFASSASSFQVRSLVAVGGDLKRLSIPDDSEAIRAKARLEERTPFEVVASNVFERACYAEERARAGLAWTRKANTHSRL